MKALVHGETGAQGWSRRASLPLGMEVGSGPSWPMRVISGRVPSSNLHKSAMCWFRSLAWVLLKGRAWDKDLSQVANWEVAQEVWWAKWCRVVNTAGPQITLFRSISVHSNLDERKQNKTKQNSIPSQGHCLWGVGMFSPRLRGFSPGASVSSNIPKMCMWDQLVCLHQAC